MTIGIPRALFYFKRPIFWKVFFEALGSKVILSPNTNKEIVEMGVRFSDPENCFSIKVFFGHLLWLDKNRKNSSDKIDFIFVPRLKTNEEKLEYCLKFFALPDLAKNLIKTPILSQEFDSRKENFEKSLQKLTIKIGRKKDETKKAFLKAIFIENEDREIIKKKFLEKINSRKRKIILISHNYNLYDEYINVRISDKLKELGTQPIFINEVFAKNNGNKKDSYNDDYFMKFHWEFGKEIMENIKKILNYHINSQSFLNAKKENKNYISGAIEISSFQCGCDAVLKEFVEEKFKKLKIPFLYLVVDDQTGDAGVKTRIEAFIDTLPQ